MRNIATGQKSAKSSGLASDGAGTMHNWAIVFPKQVNHVVPLRQLHMLLIFSGSQKPRSSGMTDIAFLFNVKKGDM